MLLLLMEKEWPLDEVVFYDTGMEFRAIYDTRDRVLPILAKKGIAYTELKPDYGFEWKMFEKPVNGRNGFHLGYSWCGGRCRWGTTDKIATVEKYGDGGKVLAVTFALDCCGMLRGLRLEAKPDGVLSVMAKERTKCDPAQAERIAWRNVKDWIAAQIALVETEQATMDELFLPKLVDQNERTLYDAFQSGRLMLGSGE